MKISVLIPVHNEEATIGSIISRLKQRGLDVLVIDDGSEDDSVSIAREAGADILKNDEKSGKGYSLRKGFAYCIKNRYDGVLMMDGDGQHDVKDVNAFLGLVADNPRKIITGNRMHDSKNMPLIRYVTNKIMSYLISSVCKQKIPDTQCGYRYVSCEILKKLDLKSNDFEIETEILIKSCKNGYVVQSVPIRTIYRDEKSKINPFRDTVRFFIYFCGELLSSPK